MNWILLTFSDCYADEFDPEALIVTTPEKWEAAKLALIASAPGDGFEASFGSNESIEYATAEEYLSNFKRHDISAEVAIGLAKVFGRYRPRHAWAENKIISLEWIFVVNFGPLPTPNFDREWTERLGFRAPPRRCKAHGNVIGRCDMGKGSDPWVPACKSENISIVDDPDPGYHALVG